MFKVFADVVFLDDDVNDDGKEGCGLIWIRFSTTSPDQRGFVQNYRQDVVMGRKHVKQVWMSVIDSDCD